MNDPPPTLHYKSPADRITTRERINASRSLSAFGAFCVFIGILLGLAEAVIYTGVMGLGISPFASFNMQQVLWAAIPLFNLGVGVTYSTCAQKIKTFSAGALTVALFAGGIHLAAAGIYLLLNVIQFAQGATSGLFLILPLLFVVCSAQLVWTLSKLRREVT